MNKNYTLMNCNKLKQGKMAKTIKKAKNAENLLTFFK